MHHSCSLADSLPQMHHAPRPSPSCRHLNLQVRDPDRQKVVFFHTANACRSPTDVDSALCATRSVCVYTPALNDGATRTQMRTDITDVALSLCVCAFPFYWEVIGLSSLATVPIHTVSLSVVGH
uniref:Uncharacterized protein n=1 Tax=Mesocestoides corti TaxID=53468 RepID=A0A5K3FIQ7_MESCO